MARIALNRLSMQLYTIHVLKESLKMMKQIIYIEGSIGTGKSRFIE